MNNPDIKTVVSGNSSFAFDLYQKLKDSEANLFFSPYSISTALAMTYAGARGDTEQQMAQILHFTLDQNRLHPAFAAVEMLLRAGQRPANIQLHLANALWPQQDYPFLEKFLGLVNENYGVLITPVDYKNRTEEARQTINIWVEEKTNDKIKELIKKGILDPLTRLVLVNAIYFKGNWASQFDPALTQESPFWLTSGESLEVPMMTQTGQFRYAESDILQVLQLPYLGNMISMIVLLPKQRDGLADLENNLPLKKLPYWVRRLFETEVEVFLPRFKLSSHFRLDNTLESLGMVDAFDPLKANFAGMDGREAWLAIGAVIHQAFVEVNEEGTEAAAATAVTMKTRGLPATPPSFRADHPFIFLIYDHSSETILFIGRVANPGQSS